MKKTQLTFIALMLALIGLITVSCNNDKGSGTVSTTDTAAIRKTADSLTSAAAAKTADSVIAANKTADSLTAIANAKPKIPPMLAFMRDQVTNADTGVQTYYINADDDQAHKLVKKLTDISSKIDTAGILQDIVYCNNDTDNVHIFAVAKRGPGKYEFHFDGISWMSNNDTINTIQLLIQPHKKGDGNPSAKAQVTHIQTGLYALAKDMKKNAITLQDTIGRSKQLAAMAKQDSINNKMANAPKDSLHHSATDTANKTTVFIPQSSAHTITTNPKGKGKGKNGKATAATATTTTVVTTTPVAEGDIKGMMAFMVSPLKSGQYVYGVGRGDDADDLGSLISLSTAHIIKAADTLKMGKECIVYTPNQNVTLKRLDKGATTYTTDHLTWSTNSLGQITSITLSYSPNGATTIWQQVKDTEASVFALTQGALTNNFTVAAK